MKVVFSDRAYAGVMAETTEKVRTETGGLFLGTVKDETWYVVEAIDPGPKSVFEVAYFEYDRQYTQHLINKIANLYEQKHSLIGLWHRHPGSFDHFSSTDDGTNARFARMNEKGAISALVNIDPHFRMTMYQVSRPCRYSVIPYEVGDHLIPGDFLMLKPPEHFIRLMEQGLRGSSSRSGVYSGFHRSKSFRSFLELVLPEMEVLEDAAGETGLQDLTSATDHIVDAIMEDLSFFSDTLGMEVSLRVDGCEVIMSQDAVDGREEVRFAWPEQRKGVTLRHGETVYAYGSGAFQKACQAATEKKEKQRQADTLRLNVSSGNFLNAFRNARRSFRNEEDTWK